MITVIARFDVKPECMDKFIRCACDCSRNSRRESGNLSYKVYNSREAENKFTFIEEWVNDKAIELHGKTPHFQEFITNIASLINGEPVIEQVMSVPSAR